MFQNNRVPRDAFTARADNLTPQTSCSSSFVLSTFGFTAVAFVTGSLALWAPTFLFRAAVFTGERPPCLQGNCASSDR